jgi:hypothetical protein
MVFHSALRLLMVTAVLTVATSIPSAIRANTAIKIEAAKGAELTKASGHWHRARTHLMSALREFDRANELVNPDSVLDAQQWRSHMMNRIVDLDRLLSPQPRASETGVRYEAAPELLGQNQR